MLRLLKLGVAMGSLFIVSVAVGKTSDGIDEYIAKTTSSEIMTSDVVVRSTPLTIEPERCVHLDNLHISDQPIVGNVDSNDFAIDSQKDDQSFFFLSTCCHLRALGVCRGGSVDAVSVEKATAHFRPQARRGNPLKSLLRATWRGTTTVPKR